MTLDAWIAGHARFCPHKTAIAFEGEALSFQALHARVHQTAHVLATDFGLRRGDRIAFYGMNHPDQFVLLFAAARLGLVLVPLNWRLALAELQFIARDCAPKALFFGATFVDKAEAVAGSAEGCVAVPVQADQGQPSLAERGMAYGGADAPVGGKDTDPVLIVYTSGTTGNPKGAVLSQRALQSNGIMSQHAYDITAGDVVLNVLPLFHVGGLNIQPLPALLHGATLVLHEKFEAEAALRALQDDRITLINTVPTLLQAMIALPEWSEADLSSLRSVSIGSTDVPVPLIEAVHARGIPLQQIYGATETGPMAIYQRADLAFCTAGSIGRRGLLCDVRLVGADGKDVAPGADGEIWIRGDNILDGYWNNPEATAASLVDGWFRTGDVARVDGDGNYWFADRIKHVIISGGENIYPAELERVLRDVDGLKEASVVGRADARWGMVPVVVAVRRDDHVTRDQILDVFDGRLARFKKPRDVVFVDALPRNALGKVIADAVRALV
ncbi:MAG: AMP-binding protein [Pseudomonadota bacterium]